MYIRMTRKLHDIYDTQKSYRNRCTQTQPKTTKKKEIRIKTITTKSSHG